MVSRGIDGLEKMSVGKLAFDSAGSAGSEGSELTHSPWYL